MAVFIIVALLTGSEWKKIIDKDGMVVLQRASKTSAFDEFNLTVIADVTPKQIEAVLWDHTSYPRTLPYVRAIKILERKPDEVYTHLQIAMPVLKDRDYCMRYYRATDDKGVVRVTAEVDDAGCPKETDDYIRMHNQDAVWTLTPTGGGTRVVYEVSADLRGSVPAAIVNMSTGAEHAKFLKAILTAAKSRQ